MFTIISNFRHYDKVNIIAELSHEALATEQMGKKIW